MLNQFDVTRDFSGTFYALYEWRHHYEQVREQLDEAFQTNFIADHNSFESCFIYGEAPVLGSLHRKIKVYSKTLDLL